MKAHGKGTKFKNMSAVTLLILLVGIETSMATVDDCPELYYWNGTACVGCSGCTLGFGVKTKCTSKQDTECHECIAGFDYSNTTGFEECIACDKFSNCLPGNPKKIKNCTIFSPPVCDGCANGYYRDLSYGGNGRCLECSPPCSSQQDESRPCNTAHDRKCEEKIMAEPTNPMLSTLSTPLTINNGAGTDSSESGTEEAGPRSGKSSPEETPLAERPWFWAVVAVVIVVPATVFMVVRCKRRQKRDLKNANVKENPLLPRGLDLPVKHLDIEKKKSVARMLNGKDNFGYFYWHIVAEKLDLGAECRAWEAANNPTEKLLSAYGELEGSTVRNLVNALREAGLTHFANEVEKLVSTTKD